MMKKILIFVFAVMAMISSCKTNKEVLQETPLVHAEVSQAQDKPVGYLPKPLAYKMNGDYAGHVAILMNDARTEIMAYPGIHDVSEVSNPKDLGDGWWLSKAGMIGPNTAFLTYTYEEYSKLTEQPTAAELMSKIIPEARVTETKTLPRE